MSSAQTDEVSEVLERVKDWPAPSKMTLARLILETLDPPRTMMDESVTPAEASRRGVPVESVVGLLRTDRRPPDDEECRQIVEEERWRKYEP